MARRKKDEVKEIEMENDNILLPEKVDIESIREELKDYIDEKVNTTFVEELEKTNKRLIREKSKRIFWKNIVIVILLLIIGFLIYLLYSNNYFDKYFNKNSDVTQEEKELKEKKEEENKDKEDKKEDNDNKEKEEKKEEIKEPTLDELKKEYESLLDNYYVTDNSIYLVPFYNGELTTDMMKYMTINTFDFSTFEKEEDYNIIKENTLKMMYEKLFDAEYTSGTFSYDDNKIRYVKGMESYMTSSVLLRDDNNIRREIKDIKVENNVVTITTIEGVVKDNKLYNIISNDEIIDYKDDSLIKYESKLNKLVYTFKNNKLISLSK